MSLQLCSTAGEAARERHGGGGEAPRLKGATLAGPASWGKDGQEQVWLDIFSGLSLKWNGTLFKWVYQESAPCILPFKVQRVESHCTKRLKTVEFHSQSSEFCAHYLLNALRQISQIFTSSPHFLRVHGSHKEKNQWAFFGREHHTTLGHLDQITGNRQITDSSVTAVL